MINERKRRQEQPSFSNARWDAVEETETLTCGAPSSSSSSSQTPKFSNGFRKMLQSDLHVTTTRRTAASTAMDCDDDGTGIDTRPSFQGSRQQRRRRSSLKDAYSSDIAVLLRSLHSATEFAGTIEPAYHSRYFIDESMHLM